VRARQTVYEEMEVDAEMQRGLLPGALALSAKFVPALRAVAYRTVEVSTRFNFGFCSARSHSRMGTRVLGARLPGGRGQTIVRAAFAALLTARHRALVLARSQTRGLAATTFTLLICQAQCCQAQC